MAALHARHVPSPLGVRVRGISQKDGALATIGRIPHPWLHETRQEGVEGLLSTRE
jgi:hypothetical protein